MNIVKINTLKFQNIDVRKCKRNCQEDAMKETTKDESESEFKKKHTDVAINFVF